MKRTKAILILSLLLPGMHVSAQELTSEYKLPKELRDCRIFRLEGPGFLTTPIKTIVCDNAVTTTTSYIKGKSTESIPRIDMDLSHLKEQLPKMSSSKEECEEFLPRNQDCVSVWVPAQLSRY